MGEFGSAPRYGEGMSCCSQFSMPDDVSATDIKICSP